MPRTNLALTTPFTNNSTKDYNAWSRSIGQVMLITLKNNVPVGDTNVSITKCSSVHYATFFTSLPQKFSSADSFGL